eukprot:1160664-Pelagomonas_calceolata.AAC.5
MHASVIGGTISPAIAVCHQGDRPVLAGQCTRSRAPAAPAEVAQDDYLTLGFHFAVSGLQDTACSAEHKGSHPPGSSWLCVCLVAHACVLCGSSSSTITSFAHLPLLSEALMASFYAHEMSSQGTIEARMRGWVTIQAVSPHRIAAPASHALQLLLVYTRTSLAW